MKATPSNSAAALREQQQSGALSRRAREILDRAARLYRPFTDREMARLLGYADMNAVRPRITELLDAGLLRDAGSVRCPVTGKRVRTSRPATPAEIRRRLESDAAAEHPPARQLPLL